MARDDGNLDAIALLSGKDYNLKRFLWITIMMKHQIIQIAAKPYGVHLITEELLKQVALNGSGVLHLFIQHTSAALALNENASSDVLQDLRDFFTQLVPESTHYRHKEEGADDMPAHIKSILC